MRYYHYISCLACLIIGVSCSKPEIKSPSTYTVKLTDFEDVIEVQGLVQSVEVTTIGTPGSVNDGVVLTIIKDGTHVKAGDTVCVLQDNSLKQRYDMSCVQLENANAELTKTKANLDLQYALLEAQVKSNAAETDIANLDSTSLRFSSLIQTRIKKLQLEQTAILKSKLQKKLKALATINNAEVRRHELNCQRFKRQIESTKQQLNELILTAPKSGLATRANHWVTDQKIQPTDPVWNRMPLIIIPGLDKMKIILSATENEYKRINENDSVVYTFDALPGNKAYGKIQKKAPVGKPVKENSKVKMFEIEASLDKYINIPGPDLTARCKIILKHLHDTIVIPEVCVFEEGKAQYVYVQKSKTFEKRQVKTGMSSVKDIVITEGLKRNEKIALLKPTQELISGTRMLAKFKENKPNKQK